MRSRFSAYATKDAQYIYETYAKESQLSQSVDDIKDWSNVCVWLALHVHSFEENNIIEEPSPEQFVEFSAYYVNENKLCVLREKSRFIQESQCEDNQQMMQWRYIDGEHIESIDTPKEKQQSAKINRNAPCPCNSGKKYKKCCL